MDIENLTDEECYKIVQKASNYAADLLLKKMDNQDSKNEDS